MESQIKAIIAVIIVMLHAGYSLVAMQNYKSLLASLVFVKYNDLSSHYTAVSDGNEQKIGREDLSRKRKECTTPPQRVSPNNIMNIPYSPQKEPSTPGKVVGSPLVKKFCQEDFNEKKALSDLSLSCEDLALVIKFLLGENDNESLLEDDGDYDAEQGEIDCEDSLSEKCKSRIEAFFINTFLLKNSLKKFIDIVGELEKLNSTLPFLLECCDIVHMTQEQEAQLRSILDICNKISKRACEFSGWIIAITPIKEVAEAKKMRRHAAFNEIPASLLFDCY